MKRLYWTHIPAIALWLGFATWFFSRISEWPDLVPLQIGWSGEATSWGSPWTGFGIVAAMGALFIGISIVLDTLWVRQESQKKFNILSLLDEFVLSLLVGIQGSLLVAAAQGAESYRFPWTVTLLIVGAACLPAILLEWKRPFRTSTVQHAAAGSADAFSKHLNARLQSGEKTVFWDIQNPKYVAWLSMGIPALLWVSAIFLSRESLWAAGINVGVGLLLVTFYGGQRTRVTEHGITIRYGLLGFTIFRCRFDEISAVRLRAFAPLADFGGYGIRMAAGLTAYYLSGRTGVQLDLIDRRSALIGSNNAERLAAAILALGGKTVTSDNEVTS